MMSLDVASWSVVVSESCSLEKWSSCNQIGFVHLKSPFLCVNSQLAPDSRHLVDKVRKVL